MVKLNNPQMGTETLPFEDDIIIQYRFSLVKLNNPQMGTETLFSFISNSKIFIILLN